MKIKHIRIILIVVIGILCILTAFFATRCYILGDQLDEVNTIIANQHTNERVLMFTKLFISKVLQSGSEVDFETRLQLENSVREIKDEQILESWNKFVNSKTESEAQGEVKALLDLLIKKISA